MDVTVIVPAFNSEPWIERCLASITAQSRTNYRCIVIDDASTDETYKLCRRSIRGDRRFVLWRRPRRSYALANIDLAIRSPEVGDNHIVVLVDGDDWLSSDDSLQSVCETYGEHSCWMTYGCFIDYPGGKAGKRGGPYPPSVVAANSYRTHPWLGSHLRTFRAGLYRRISRPYITDPRSGLLYTVTWDMAIMFPMLEMSGPRAQHIDNVLYVYNRNNPIGDSVIRREDQLEAERIIRSYQPHKPL